MNNAKIAALLQKAHKGANASFNPKSWAAVITALPGWKWESIGSRLEPKFLVTAPNGKTNTIVKLPRYRVVTFYDFTSWLKNETSFYADVAAALGVEIYDPTTVYVRTQENTGTCPVCLRNIKLTDAKKMVHHGYQRPGYGYIVGDCFGVGYPPYELAPNGCSAYLECALFPRLESEKKALENLESGKVESFSKRETDYDAPRVAGRYQMKTVTTRKGDTDFPRVLAVAIVNAQNMIVQLLEDVSFFQEMVANWKLAPLPVAGLRVKDGR